MLGIAPFAAHISKIYPLQRMEEVVAAVSKTGEDIILFGAGEQELSILRTWVAKYPHTRISEGGLRADLETIRNLRLMLCMDSANMHLASLVGTRVISIWGATHPDMGFLGAGQQRKDCIIRNLDCQPCSAYGKKQCKYGDYRCLDIDPQTILDVLTRDL